MSLSASADEDRPEPRPQCHRTHSVEIPSPQTSLSLFQGSGNLGNLARMIRPLFLTISANQCRVQAAGAFCA
jgi:hypothetical protein